MSIKTALATSAATLAIGAGIWFCAPDRPDALAAPQPHRAAAEHSIPEISVLRAQVADLRRQLEAQAQAQTASAGPDPAGALLALRVAKAERQLAELSLARATNPASSVPPREQASLAQDAIAAVQQEETATTQALQTTLEARLYDENLDPRWAREQEDRISRDLTSEILAGNQLSGVQCQSSLCRMEIHSVDLDAQERLASGYGNLSAFADSQVFWKREQQSDGSMVTQLYLMREGQALPSVQ